MRWEQTVKLDASPRDIAAIDALLGAMLAKSSPETILEAAKLALTWQDHVIQLSVSGGKDSKLRERLGLLSLSSNVLERIYRAASGLPGGAPAPPATAAPLPGSQLRSANPFPSLPASCYVFSTSTPLQECPFL